MRTVTLILASSGLFLLAACTTANTGGQASGGKPQMCGGIAGIQCPQGFVCADDKTDDCDPTKGGADCSGICVAEGTRPGY